MGLYDIKVHAVFTFYSISYLTFKFALLKLKWLNGSNSYSNLSCLLIQIKFVASDIPGKFSVLSCLAIFSLVAILSRFASLMFTS